ncbi:MAG: ABC transporter permease [Synechococcales cyanobacterium]
MGLWTAAGMAWQMVQRHKLRTGLTMLGILIGNASVIAIAGFGHAAQVLAVEQFRSLGTNLLIVFSAGLSLAESPNTRPITVADLQAINDTVPAVAEAVGAVATPIRVIREGIDRQYELTGTQSGYLTVLSLEMEHGRFLIPNDLERQSSVVVLGSEAATQLFGANTAAALHQTVFLNNQPFEVVGVLRSKPTVFGNSDSGLFAPLNVVSQQFIGRESPYGTELRAIYISAVAEEQLPAAEFQVRNLLRQRHQIQGADDFIIRNQQQLLDIANTVLGLLRLLLTGTASLSLIVGGVGIMNVMIIAVAERTHEIGLRKAIGADSTSILQQFATEAILIAVTGGTLGIVLSSGLMLIIRVTTPIVTAVDPVAVTVSFLLSTAIGLVFGIAPARQAARLDPIEALRV